MVSPADFERGEGFAPGDSYVAAGAVWETSCSRRERCRWAESEAKCASLSLIEQAGGDTAADQESSDVGGLPPSHDVDSDSNRLEALEGRTFGLFCAECLP